MLKVKLKMTQKKPTITANAVCEAPKDKKGAGN